MSNSTNDFPEFWYESNACWGKVRSLGDLKEKLELQLAENNSIHNVDDFLDKSLNARGLGWNFGTRREHIGNYSLRDLLKDNGLLDEFSQHVEVEK